MLLIDLQSKSEVTSKTMQAKPCLKMRATEELFV